MTSRVASASHDHFTDDRHYVVSNCSFVQARRGNRPASAASGDGTPSRRRPSQAPSIGIIALSAPAPGPRSSTRRGRTRSLVLGEPSVPGVPVPLFVAHLERDRADERAEGCRPSTAAGGESPSTLSRSRHHDSLPVPPRPSAVSASAVFASDGAAGGGRQARGQRGRPASLLEIRRAAPPHLCRLAAAELGRVAQTWGGRQPFAPCVWHAARTGRLAGPNPPAGKRERE
jgi:hypothetical protein